MERAEKIQICKVVAQAILSDAQITDSERDFLEKLMTRYELDSAERKDVLNRNFGADPAELAKGLDVFDTQNELLVELALAIAVDGEIAPQEMDLLRSVGKVFNVSEADLDLMVKAAIC